MRQVNNCSQHLVDCEELDLFANIFAYQFVQLWVFINLEKEKELNKFHHIDRVGSDLEDML